MPSHWSRRRALQRVAAALRTASAGCAGVGPSGQERTGAATTPLETPTPTSTSSPSLTTDDGLVTLSQGETHETPAGWTITVEILAVHPSVVESSGTHPDPVYGDGEQYVVADAVVGGADAPDPADLSLFARTDTGT